jgi:carotenoid cleavage dioxygenase-like enzyme
MFRLLQVVRTGSIPLEGGKQKLVHDCAMSQKYLVFCIDPWTLQGADFAKVHAKLVLYKTYIN